MLRIVTLLANLQNQENKSKLTQGRKEKYLREKE